MRCRQAADFEAEVTGDIVEVVVFGRDSALSNDVLHDDIDALFAAVQRNRAWPQQ